VLYDVCVHGDELFACVGAMNYIFFHMQIYEELSCIGGIVFGRASE
jgi:hypothetical protein